ncbi:MAG: hypothetical protein M0037_00375 [Betaproteobacteria bacterium]|nr:hypothetical protein [Betaproteobacteria bacterium]
MRIYTKADICTLLSIKPRTVNSWVAKGILPAPAYFGREPRWSPNGTVWQVTDPSDAASNRLKQLKIKPPSPILDLA